MTNTQPVWLTRQAYEQLKDELADLVRQRSGHPADPWSSEPDTEGERGPDHDSVADPRDRDQRIRKLQEMLRNPIVGAEPPDDGVAEPGMVLTVRYADDPDTETFLLAEREQDAYPDIEICSPGSPLGSALVGATEGDQRQYLLPNGRAMVVTLLRATPYKPHHGATSR